MCVGDVLVRRCMEFVVVVRVLTLCVCVFTLCVCVCVCACERACVRACSHCVCACGRVCVHVCGLVGGFVHYCPVRLLDRDYEAPT